jgi:hypothetical protein
MLHLFGCSISPADAFTIVDLLQSHGRAVDLETAATIESGLQRNLVVIGLNAVERDAILAALDDPPASLVELHRALTRDQQDRAA